MTQLPAHLQNLKLKTLNDAALAGIGAGQPPHISIRGNTFTLVDASGATQVAGPVLDVCVADISDVMCKLFYGNKWTPDSNEPPLCWSANGIGPSRDATQPQSPTCAACPNNERGSAVSAMSGVAIKACRDEKWLAVLIPSLPAVRFQLKITPGSFKNWQAYVKTCEGSGAEVNTILTRIAFEAGVNGVLTFQAVNYIDEPTAKVLAAGYAEKAFDVLVGRTDVPKRMELAAPAGAVAVGYVGQQAEVPAQQMAQPTAAAQTFQPQAPAVEHQAAPAPVGFAQPAPAARPRRRRTKAEIEAANAQGGGAQAPAAATGPATAPFRPQAPENAAPAAQPGFMATTAAPAGGFGMAQGVAPNAELTTALAGLFGNK